MTKFKIGSEDEDGGHIRELTGWPYSIYIKRDEIGSCDAVLCHGIQSFKDAEMLLALCNQTELPDLHHNQMFAWKV